MLRLSPIVLALVAVTGSTAHAVTPPTITGLTADPWAPPNSDPTEVYVLGDARFSNEEPVTVGSDGYGDPERREAGLFGMDLKSMAIWQPESTIPSLSFAMSFYDFQAIAPEVTAWRWTFKVAGVPYQLEAARGGATLPSTLDAGPVALFMQDGLDAFRLLGPCNADASSCPFHSTVEGTLDTNSDRLLWQVPIGTAPFTVGTTLAPHPAGATASIGVGPHRYHDRMTQTGSYTILGQSVSVWVQSLTGDRLTPVYQAFLPPPENGVVPFWANLSIGHLDTGPVGPTNDFNVVAQACVGSLCSPVNCAPQVRVGCVGIRI